MPKVTVDAVTITKIGDSVSVHAGNKPHVFSDAQEAIRFAGQALGLPEPKTFVDLVLENIAAHQATEMAATEVMRRQNAHYGKSPAAGALDDIRALNKAAAAPRKTSAQIAEEKRLEKNRKQRERAAKKRKAVKRKK